MTGEAVTKSIGPFDKYTEVLVEGVGTVGVPKHQVCKFTRNDETGGVDLSFTASKPAAKKAASKGSKK